MNSQITHDEVETIDLARRFAAELRAGDCVCLWGDLGVGKSVFCRSIIKALSCDENIEVPSPTFTLVQMYPTLRGVIWHFDLYRLSDPAEVYEIGWEEACAGGIALIEWPCRLGALLPARRIDVRLDLSSGEPNQRSINIERQNG